LFRVRILSNTTTAPKLWDYYSNGDNNLQLQNIWNKTDFGKNSKRQTLGLTRQICQT
jgi:hypothetical protein